MRGDMPVLETLASQLEVHQSRKDSEGDRELSCKTRWGSGGGGAWLGCVSEESCVRNVKKLCDVYESCQSGEEVISEKPPPKTSNARLQVKCKVLHIQVFISLNGGGKVFWVRGRPSKKKHWPLKKEEETSSTGVLSPLNTTYPDLTQCRALSSTSSPRLSVGGLRLECRSTCTAQHCLSGYLVLHLGTLKTLPLLIT